jgi:hypothetical protein
MPIPLGHRVHAQWPGGSLIGTYDDRAGDLIHLTPVGGPERGGWVNLRVVYILSDLGAV